MKAKRVHGAGLLVALGFASSPAHSQAPAARASLDYRQDADCPDSAAFRARITARTPVVFDAAANRSLTVVVQSGTPSRGRLRFAADGGAAVREVAGATCDEVVSALALIAAVALERGVLIDDGETPTATEPLPAEPPPVAAPVTPPATAPVTPPAAAPAAVPPTPGPQEDRDAAHGGTGGTGAPLRWAVGAQALLAGGVGPALAGGGRAFAEASIDVATRPALRASLAWLPGTDRGTELGTEREPERGTVHFSLLAARLEACPVRLELRAFALSPCASFDAGRIGVSVSEPESRTIGRVWLAPGALVRLGLSLTPVLALELEGGFIVPLDRYRFFFSPEPFVYKVPAISGSAGLGLAVRFP